jgi:hypothetical protein
LHRVRTSIFFSFLEFKNFCPYFRHSDRITEKGKCEDHQASVPTRRVRNVPWRNAAKLGSDIAGNHAGDNARDYRRSKLSTTPNLPSNSKRLSMWSSSQLQL